MRLALIGARDYRSRATLSHATRSHPSLRVSDLSTENIKRMEKDGEVDASVMALTKVSVSGRHRLRCSRA
ncbi:hypothetical protein C8Q76DRAFT_361709 [Earliella scabrosa]|nr:hypothetical protein C8Q76DRAFT_361709 [Earliella scabrosa]